jgi:hypothetical protein
VLIRAVISIGLLAFASDAVAQAMQQFARAVNAREIEIVGYRGAARLSNGQVLAEEADIGKRRAEQFAMLFRARI